MYSSNYIKFILIGLVIIIGVACGLPDPPEPSNLQSASSQQGKVVFYSYGVSYSYNVYIDYSGSSSNYSYAGKIDYYIQNTPDCGDTYCLTKELKSGTYYYYIKTTGSSPITKYGSFTIFANGCTKVNNSI